MKRLFTLLMLAFVAMSCEQIQDFIDPKGHGLVFLEGEMKAYFDDKGDTKNYKFQADLAWSAEVSADWVEVDPTSGPAGENKIKIKVDKNKSEERRTGYVDITLSNDKSYRIELEQLASGENLDDIIEPTTPIPNNEIWYTSTDGEIVEPNDPTAFNVSIKSNIYEDGKGVITFDGEVTEVGEMAFYGCNDCTTNCYNLTSFILPQSVTSIGNHAFDGCRNLQSVTISDNVTHIGDTAFICCTGLKEFNSKYASEDGRCLIIDGTLNSFAPAGLAEYTIPDSVTTIGEQAFRNCSSLTSVTIPDSVTAIGDYAFANCYSLTSVTIPDSVTTIGRWAFYECSSLTSVTIGDGVTTIGDGVFFGCDSLTKFNGKFVSEDGRCLIVDDTLMSFAIGCGATEYVIPPSVTVIGHYAFYRCFSLTSVTIPDGVTTIGVGAFAICNSLTSVTIPDSVTTIGDAAFAGCSSLREFRGKYASEDGRCLFFNGILKSFAPSGLTEYTIPDSVTAIGWNAFSYCYSLTSVTIPDSVIAIGYEAFYGCSSLTNVYCKAITPPTAEVYDNYWRAFDENASSRKIYVPIESVEAYKSANYWGNYADAIVGYNFETGEVDDTEKPEEPELSEYVIEYTSTDGDIVVPYDIMAFDATIVSNVYKDGKGMLCFDREVTTIGDYAFNGCSSLRSVTIPDSVTTIGDCAFNGCSSLTNVTIGDSVTTIGEAAFWDCDSLTSITIPDSVTTIGDNAFSSCDSLTRFNGKYASEDGRCLIIDGTLNSFAPAGLTEYTILYSVTTIGNFAFAYCGSLTSVTIPDSVTVIGEGAFFDCWCLTSVTIGDSVTEIGGAAFYRCSSLTSVTIPDSVTTIGWDAFYGCRSLTSVTIPDSVTTIGEGAFASCSSLTEFKGKYASEDGRYLIIDGTLNSFAIGCGVTEYTIPDSVTTIGNSAFSACSSLTSVVIPDSVTTIGNSAFSACSSLTSVVIPNSVTTIGDDAFCYCRSLTSVTIPDSVTTIGTGAFAWCSSLTSVYCKAVTPPAGGYDMFYSNASGRKIYVPMESVEAYKSANGWSDYADAIFGYEF